MLKLTKTGIGLLTRQYRSVLKKCWLINVGLFEAIGKMAEVSSKAAKKLSGALTTAAATVAVAGAAVTAIPDEAEAGTIDDATATAKSYYSGLHEKYTLTTLGTGRSAAYAKIPVGAVRVLINGTYYYFTPNEGTAAKNAAAATLANIGGSVLTTGFSTNYFFTDGTNYWLYSTYNLPTSSYTVSAVTENTDPGFYTKRYVKNADGSYGESGYLKYGLKDAAYGGGGSSNAHFYKWDWDANGNLILTQDGASESSYDVIVQRNSAHTRIDTDQAGADVSGTFDGLQQSSSGGAQSSSGGAIYNYASTIGNITAPFIGNYATSSASYASGGAIYNGASTIGNITGDFVGNYVTSSASSAYGGAISNADGSIGNVTGDFIGNYANAYSSSATVYARGGAIYSNLANGSITGDFIGNYVSASTSTDELVFSYGGAIYEGSSSYEDIVGDFSGNYANASSTSRNARAIGGAIYTGGATNSIIGDFSGNYANAYSSSATAYALGGAIYNEQSSRNSINNITGDFISNYVKATGSDSYALGGAIFNQDLISSLSGNFINNSATVSDGVALGGAIYNNFYSSENAIINLVAQDRDVNFYNNTVKVGDNDKVYNDIYQGLGTSTSLSGYQGIINLNANSGHSISFGGTIDGDSNYLYYNRLNLNQDDTNYGGEYNFFNGVFNHTITIGSSDKYTRESTINLGKILQADGETTTYGTIQNSTITNNANTRLSMQNDYVGSLQENNITSLTLNHDLKFAIDVALNGNSGTADKLGVALNDITANNGSKVVIDSINVAGKYGDSGKTATVNILSNAEASSGKYALADSDVMNLIEGNNYFTDVQYDPETGNLTLSDKLINQSALDEELNNYYTKYGFAGKKHLSSLAVCGASPRQGILSFGKAASISDIALRKGQIAGRSDAQRTSSDDNIGFAAANDNMPTSRASVRVFARGVAPQFVNDNINHKQGSIMNNTANTLHATADKVPTAKPSGGTKAHKFAFVTDDFCKTNRLLKANNDNFAFVTIFKQAI